MAHDVKGEHGHTPNLEMAAICRWRFGDLLFACHDDSSARSLRPKPRVLDRTLPKRRS